MNSEQHVTPGSDADVAWVSDLLAAQRDESMPDSVRTSILRALALEQHRRVVTDDFDPSASVDDIELRLSLDADVQAAQSCFDPTRDSRKQTI